MKAIEDGKIVEINFNVYRGWYVEISSQNANRKWSYLHLFTGSDGKEPVYSCSNSLCTNTNKEWELRIGDLVNPVDENDIKHDYIIIKWNGIYVNKVYCIGKYEGRYIQNKDGTYLMKDANTRAITKSEVEEGEEFAPSGNSGRAGTIHLHLAVNGGEDNPLRYLRHTPDGEMNVVIEEPEDGHIFTEEEKEVAYPITITVDSTEGLDLDKVDVWIYKNGSEKEEDKIHIPPVVTPTETTRRNTFQYGGVPGEDKTKNIRKFSEGVTGVIPIGNVPGTDKFILYQNFGDLKLPYGMHELVVRAEDVNGNSMYAKNEFYILPKGAVLYASKNITGNDKYTKVRIKDMHMEEGFVI